MQEIKPLIKIAWNTDVTKKQWSDSVNSIAKLTERSEYETVKQGLREANIYHMHPQNFDREIQQIVTDGLVFLPITRSKLYTGFSHKHFPVKELDSNSFVYGVVAKDLATAKEFVKASEDKDHIAIGQFLGYPKCCCEAFKDNWVNKRVLDPCYEAAINTADKTINELGVHVKINPLINPLLRYFGIKIAPFFPCSYDCQMAISIGEIWFNFMQTIDGKAAITAKELLEQPMSWSLYKSLIYIKTSLFKGIVNGYDCANRKDIIANEQ